MIVVLCSYSAYVFQGASAHGGRSGGASHGKRMCFSI
jgi:hypothetical protein